MDWLSLSRLRFLVGLSLISDEFGSVKTCYKITEFCLSLMLVDLRGSYLEIEL